MIKSSKTNRIEGVDNMLEHTVEKFYRIIVCIEHNECVYLCNQCRGSGEGCADGTSCPFCGGLGEIRGGMEGTREFVVEWFDSDLWEVIEGDSTECEGCGYNFLDEIEDELKDLEEKKVISND